MASIEILLDPQSDEAIRHEWRRLSEAGVPSQHDHTGESNAPHITALYSTAVPEALQIEPPAGPLVLGSALLFPTRRGFVLSRAVIVTRELLAWHARLHAAVGDRVDIEPNTLPDAWTPHVTLSRRVSPEMLVDALAQVGTVPLIAGALSVRLWDATTRTVTSLSD